MFSILIHQSNILYKSFTPKCDNFTIQQIFRFNKHFFVIYVPKQEFYSSFICKALYQI